MNNLHPIFANALAAFAPPAQRECGECGELFTPNAGLGFRRDAMCSYRCVNDSMMESSSEESEDADGDE